ncbi:MAG: hypothetical protein R3Y13_02325 [bacterium]
MEESVKKKKKNITVIVISILVTIFVVIPVMTIFVVSNIFGYLNEVLVTSSMNCVASDSNIKIYYEGNQIVDFLAEKVIFDIDDENELVDQIGIETYLNNYSAWYEKNFNGKCER